MFGRKVKLFKLFGFTVNIDISWIVIAVLVTWSLAEGFLPNHYPSEKYPGMSWAVYWVMGAICALGLFASIVFHEFAHSLVARRFGLPMKGITLFIFGGVSEMTEEPPSPTAEFWTGIAGPMSSVVLALGFLGLFAVSRAVAWPVMVEGTFYYLSWINGMLVVFNMVPAFPLDGGRVLRSALWGLRGNLRWATSIASKIGSAFGVALIVLGALSFFYRNVIGGVWLFLIGLFLRSSAQMAYQQLLLRQALEGEAVRRFMNANPVTVSPSATVRELVDDYVYKYHYKMFPVVEGDRLVGCVSTREVKELPQEQWSGTTVEEVAVVCDRDTAVAPDLDATKALSKMVQGHVSRLLVVEGERLVGIITLKDMMKFLSLKIELERTE